MTALIELDGLSYTYPGAAAPAIRGLRLSIDPGEWLWITGGAGSGKSTLVRLLCGMQQSWPGGQIEGVLRIEGEDRLHGAAGEASGTIGVVFQDPESGLVLDWVEDELAFAPENLGVSVAEIEARVQEALGYLDIPGIAGKRTGELSGGQQQRVAIASILTMQPRVWLLDDPAASLDAPAAAKLMALLRELHEQGHTICLFSSRLREENPGASRLVLLEEGRLLADGPYAEVLGAQEAALRRLGCLPPETSACGVGASFLHDAEAAKTREPLLEADRVRFSYSGEGPALEETSLKLYAGELVAVSGPNGVGKTTLGKLLAGLLTPRSGTIRLEGKSIRDYTERQFALAVGYGFQQPDHRFIAPNVLEECIFSLLARDHPQLKQAQTSDLPREILELGESWLARFDLTDKRMLPPQQLSTAEKHRLALVSILILSPRVIILDEPTAGLDYRSADELMALYADYARRGHAVVVITHDLTTARRHATREFRLGG